MACGDAIDVTFPKCYSAEQMSTFAQSLKNYLCDNDAYGQVPASTLPEYFLSLTWGSLANLPDPTGSPVLTVVEGLNIWQAVNNPAFDLGTNPVTPGTGTAWVMLGGINIPVPASEEVVFAGGQSTLAAAYADLSASSHITITPVYSGIVKLTAMIPSVSEVVNSWVTFYNNTTSTYLHTTGNGLALFRNTTLIKRVTGLTINTPYNFRLRWRSDGTNTISTDGNSSVIIMAEELWS